MPLWISLHLPTHSLDMLFPHWPTETPVAAVLDNERVLACTPAASAQGVKEGMQRNTAAGFASGISFARHCAAAEQQNLREIALGLLQYTPNIALFGHHTLLLEVSASLLLFHGPRHLWRRIETSAKNMGLNARLGMAPTAHGARLLACQTQYRTRRVLQAKSLRRRLDPLPASALPAATPYMDWLQSIGCHTLGQLNGLPRAGLRQRTSPLLLQELDAAYGRSKDHLTWFTAPDLFSRRIDLIEHIEYAEATRFIAKRLIEQLCHWLQARQLAVDGLCITLHHDQGRYRYPPVCITLKFSRPSWRPDDFSNILTEELHRTTLKAPIVAVGLSIAHAAPRPPINRDLFPEPSQWLDQEHRLLDLLRARLGADRILWARPQADHRPEHANCWIAFDSPEEGGSRATQCKASGQATGSPPRLHADARPFWLLPAPLPLALRNDHPVYNGSDLRLIRGPERTESGWWTDSGHEQRDYFMAQDRNGARYWIYRQRESPRARWFLHGLFG